MQFFAKLSAGCGLAGLFSEDGPGGPEIYSYTPEGDILSQDRVVPDLTIAPMMVGSRAPSQDAELVVMQHSLLVRRIAHNLMSRLPSCVHIDDLVQAGMVGLLEATQHFDPCQGASFETYAGFRIRGAMLDELRRYDWTPRSVHRKAREISEAIRIIEADAGRDARDSEVADYLKVSLEDYHQILQDTLACRVLSIEELLESGDAAWEQVTHATAEPEERLARAGFATALADAIAGLPERERLIISLYYEEEQNLREIGEVLGITESRVCQIQGQALLRLRARLAGWRDERQNASPRRRSRNGVVPRKRKKRNSDQS